MMFFFLNWLLVGNFVLQYQFSKEHVSLYNFILILILDNYFLF